ncbi:hypothetical protein TH25_13280 [Thalassospira profundimaris]|uniref:asparagine synthase (glutamine-hydrolyzing) n=1 Tax=Thalassospira profundimaris TaxID=502049 RepID=A0A367XBA6_9PROT|nr:asparagine synthase-related protein [Thalassospira profundimaris]RCK49952.1 hypothetical protein TH25_13280 [Thalassospira profundimaris]
MCGLAGTTDPEAQDWVVAASGALAHRGPDGHGMWQDGGTILAHRRLATTDMRAIAAQPMHSENQRFVFVFNGYVAGYRRLHARLKRTGIPDGAGAASYSDTAVLLSLLAQALTSADMPCDQDDAIGAAFKRMASVLGDISGAYAFALWDRHQQALWLAVDTGGQKPLYVVERGDGHLFFASEITPLLSVPGIVQDRDADAFDLSLAHLFVPAPKTAFRAIRQLCPGEVLCWQGGNPRGFQLSDPATRGRARHSANSRDHRVTALRKRVYRAVADAMQCDRPVACLLSGGMDSAGIAALAARVARHRSRDHKMPTAIVMGFPGQPFDETARARQLAAHLGMKLEIVTAPQQGEDILNRLKSALRAFGGPFANPAVVLAHCLAETVADIAPVCLTGDGGDEVFGGYRRYRMANHAEKWLKVPHYVRQAVADGVTWAETRLQRVGGGNALAGAGKFLRATTGQPDDVFTAWNSRCILPGYGRLQAVLPDGAVDENAWPQASRMMQFDQCVTLPGNQLAISDRMGMAAGVEYRPPLLDLSVRALAASIPVHDHVPGGGKAVWRAVVSPLVPVRYLAAAKSGFNPPIGTWLRDVCRLLWVTDIQAQNRLFAPVAIPQVQRRVIWQRALANDFDAALTVWNLFVWHIWQEGEVL